MPKNVTVSIVFVGGDFSPNLIGEHDLEHHLGDLDTTGLIKVGPIAQFSYSSQKFQLTISPDRIDLKGFDVVFLQEELLSAARAIIDALLPVRNIASVTGFGLNCDTLFYENEVGQTGTSFCMERLISPDSLSFVGGEPYMATTARYYFVRPPIRYDVRFEPHFSSDGRQLFVAVNGHQDVSQQAELLDLLDAVPTVREYIDGLHGRIMTREGENQ